MFTAHPQRVSRPDHHVPSTEHRVPRTLPRESCNTAGVDVHVVKRMVPVVGFVCLHTFSQQ